MGVRRGASFASAAAGIVCLAVVYAGGALGYVSSTWYEDASGYEEATRQQKLYHAPLLVYFRVDWCPYCRAFDQLLTDSEMRSKLGEVIKVRVNPEHGDAEMALFEQRFGGKGYPAIYWVTDGGAPRRLSAKGPASTFLAQLDR
ncbi:MAG: thioredoxin family protein [Deltaproteobacteria bacterium]|nr:thioredoxin family protein [Deltaproteobacteria bacterium]